MFIIFSFEIKRSNYSDLDYIICFGLKIRHFFIISVCYLFAGQPNSKTAEISINQNGQFFQNFSEKQYWQSNKVPMPLTMNKTTTDLYIRDGDNVGPTYTIHVTRAME